MINIRDNVRYTGNTVPSLKGHEGTVENFSDNGFVMVRFGGDLIKCAEVNLTVID